MQHCVQLTNTTTNCLLRWRTSNMAVNVCVTLPQKSSVWFFKFKLGPDASWWQLKKGKSAQIFPGPPNLFGQPWKDQIRATKREKTCFFLSQMQMQPQSRCVFSLIGRSCLWLWLALLGVPFLVRVKMICPLADLCSFTCIGSRPSMAN